MMLPRLSSTPSVQFWDSSTQGVFIHEKKKKVESRRGEVLWFPYTNYKSIYRSPGKSKELGSTPDYKLKAIYFIYNQGHSLMFCKTSHNFFRKGYSKVKWVWPLGTRHFTTIYFIWKKHFHLNIMVIRLGSHSQTNSDWTCTGYSSFASIASDSLVLFMELLEDVFQINKGTNQETGNKF